MRGSIGNVVFDAPYAGSLEAYGRAAGAIARLYAELLGIPLQSRADMYRSLDYPADEGDEMDPVLRHPDPHGIGIAFELQSPGYEPPRWPDPAYPQQIHLDIFTPDLGAAGDLVTKLGAVKLQQKEQYRTYADPVGHPFCLTEDAGHESAAPGRIGRIVFDCLSPRSLAAFYGELLDMDEQIEDSPEWVVNARSDGSLPMLGFQHAVFAAPRWPDPAYPEQVHLDLGFDDPVEAGNRAARLGAIKLPEGDVWVDPAGHPFCMG